MMWRHRAPPPPFANHRTIGKPILHDTSFDEKLLETLPHVREALLLKRRAHEHSSAPQQPAAVHPRDKRASDVPTASSVYTQSPDLADRFDDVHKVAPLFADCKKQAFPHIKMDIVSKRRLSFIPVPVQSSNKLPRRPSDDKPVRPLKPALPGLGIHTASSLPQDAHEWQGASGGTTLLTPIAGTPVHSERAASPSISPISDDASYSYHRRPPPPPVPRKTEHGLTHGPAATTPRGHQAMPDVFRAAEPVSPEPAAEPSKSRFSWTTKASSAFQTTPEQVTSLPLHEPAWSPPPTHLSAAQQLQQPGSRFSWTTVATTVPADSSPPPTRASQVPPQQESSWSTIGTPAKPSSQQQQPQSQVPAGSRAPARPVEQVNPYIFEEDTPPIQQQIWAWGPSAPTYSPKQPSPYQDQADTPTSRSPPQPMHNPRRRPLTLAPNDNYNATPNPNTPMRATPIRRKPTPSILDTTPAPSPSTPADPHKDLPPAPPALDSIDLLTSLDAELESLGNRRANLTKLIAALTTLDPLSPIAPPGRASAAEDMARRRADRERARAWEGELADVRLREHEVGVRLLKAWKRREENVEAPSALWVRRATK